MGHWENDGIVGERIYLYVGTHFTRIEMIREHIGDKGRTWKECRANGDRAIKVLVIPL